MSTIKIFLASSEELKPDRLEFENSIGRQNKILQQNDAFLYLDIWEDFIDAISQTRLQDEYNKKIEAADIFIMLFFTKVGMFTSEEFDKALEGFKARGKPLIYTYFKNTEIKFDQLKREDANSVWDFQEKLKALGHFYTPYESPSDLKLHFKEQLEKLFTEGYFNIRVNPSLITKTIPKCLSAGQPYVTPDFLGRDIEMADIKSKLSKNGMLLINAEGGMGKTTLAAKYLQDNQQDYEHYAWIFCDGSITEQMKTLAQQLQVDMSLYKDENAQLHAIKTAMQNLEQPCLLVLDNANDEKYIEVFRQHFGGLHWHLLLTSRCQDVFPGNEYTLNHLKPIDAKALFKKYHFENNADFENLLNRFLSAVGFNTLMIELFSKNMHELAELDETFGDMINSLGTKGLLLGEKSFEVQTNYTGNIHIHTATTDNIIEALYNLAKLEETDRHLLVNMALLPAENYKLSFLIELMIPIDKFTFTKQLKTLARKGWLNIGTDNYRMSPVVQQIILEKNKASLTDDSVDLINNLNEKLSHNGVSLNNLKTYAAAKPFAEIARAAIGNLITESFETALLLLNLSDYYKGVGDFIKAMQNAKASAEIFRAIDSENYTVCLSRIGAIYKEQGNFKKALELFELRTELVKKLSESNPKSEFLKNGLVVSYEQIGEIYQLQGDFKKALQFFELRTQLSKELIEANPDDEILKYSLAISYSRLGNLYQQQGDFKKALHFFELRTQVNEELVQINPNSELLKNGLAISYEKLGEIYVQQGDFKKALQFFEQDLELTKELFDTNPKSESLKNGLAVSSGKIGEIYFQQGDLKKAFLFMDQVANLLKEMFESNPHSELLKNNLAVSYGKIGEIYLQQENLKKALHFFELRSKLGEELFETNPHSVPLHNGLSVSYSRLGQVYEKMRKPKKAKEYYLKAESIWLELSKKVPDAVEFWNNLAWIQSKLTDL